MHAATPHHHPVPAPRQPRLLKLGQRARTALLAVTFALGCGLAGADSGHDHDRARQALQAGEILPLSAILERVERDHPGKVLDVELDRDKDDGVERWVYEVKVLTSRGTRFKLKFDGKSGLLISRKAKD